MKKKSLSFCLLLGAYLAFGQTPPYREVNPLPKPRQMHGAVVMGNNLYVLGGNNPNERYVNTVFKATIQNGGSLGAWEETTPLPIQKSYIENSTLVLNDIVYVVAGLNGNLDISSNDILWTRPSANGHLEEWRKSVPYNGDGVHCSVALATPGYIHLIGGLKDDDKPSKDVWSARIAQDGAVIGWEHSSTLTSPLWYHCGGVAGGYVWIWAGLTTRDDSSVNNKIYYAPVLSSGKIGAWKVYTSSLPTGFYAASTTISRDYLLSFCPRYTGRAVSNDIWFCQVSSSGLSDWNKIQTNLPSRIYIGLATDYRRGYIYIPGGRPDDVNKYQLNNNVFMFKTRKSENRLAGTDIAQTMEVRQEIGASYSYMQHSMMPVGDIPGFVRFEQARGATGQPMLVYFHTKKAKNCQMQEQILKSLNTAKYQGRLQLAELDTLKFPQIAQQYGVFIVPCWIYFDVRGNTVERKYGIIELKDLSAIIGRIAGNP